jgi:hypothetical protein
VPSSLLLSVQGTFPRVHTGRQAREDLRIAFSERLP